MDFVLVVVNGVGMEIIRVVVVKFYLEFVFVWCIVYVKICLYNVFVVFKKFKVDFVLYCIFFVGGDVEVCE